MKGYQSLISILSIFYLFNFSCYSQNDFRRGTIITNANDTISGFIDCTTPEESYKYCYFRKDSLSEVIRYSPEEIKAYNIFDYKYFVSKWVDKGKSSDFYFLEYLLKGIVNLYYIGSELNNSYYIEKGNKLHELTNEEVEFYSNGIRMRKNSNRYVMILNYIMSDANGLQREISSTRFDHLGLIQLTKDYHNIVCKDEQCVVYYKKQNKLNDLRFRIKYGILVDYVWSNLYIDAAISFYAPSSYGFLRSYGFIKDAYANDISKTHFNYQTRQVVPGLYININRNRQLSLQLELKYQDLNYSGIRIKKLQSPVYIMYDLNRYKKFTPYVKIGLVNNYYFAINNERICVEYYELDLNSVRDYPHDNPVYYEKVLYFTKNNFIYNNYNLSFALDCGIKYNPGNNNFIGLEIKYNPSPLNNLSRYGSNISAKSDISSKIKNMSLSVNYSF